jgi:thiopeptide-type bacteriocin biosynthesis protein
VAPGSLPLSQEADCLYYKIYTAGGAAALEWLIVETLPKVLAAGPMRRWFFLRYWDEGGLHLRLRLWPERSVPALREAVGPLLDRALAEVPESPRGFHRPAVVARNAVAAANIARTRSRVEPAVYEPEVEIFGAAGIEIAERLFTCSSEVALDVLVAERDGRCSRKGVSLALMSAVLDAFPPAVGVEGFWQRYADYWLGRDPEQRGSWRQQFEARAETLEARGAAFPIPEDQLPAAAVDAVRRWRSALHSAAGDFAGLREAPAIDDLASHFVHLTNNRLGLLHLEEAYFAVLLARGAASPR